MGLAAGKNWRLLSDQIKEFKPVAVALAGEQELKCLKREIASGGGIELLSGRAGMERLALMPDFDLAVMAVTGAAGIRPTIDALSAGKDVALANKETLVAAGRLVMELSARKKASILPVDSEHSAIWQCLDGRQPGEIEKIILTASGGPFREFSLKEMDNVTVDMALNHPNWKMGGKITVDSATLMNKGLEVIEAKWLFDVSYSKIEVIVHPQSIIHSAVEFLDGSVIAQMGLPDMRLPIQYALTYPNRVAGPAPRLKLIDLQGLTFEAPNTQKFPCLRLAYEAGLAGGTAPAVLSAANEVAVASFLQGALKFTCIPAVIESVLQKHHSVSCPELDEIMEADCWARETGYNIIRNFI
ncbi:MAG: 1-deoxy-D-xylulose-5-phosphate reductoisomerase [Desulfotomaculaceae bacterium]|nr:1-deoxy-D-xylulose-5-phosphate reductoisomerase [Desulfotomaculaceae bacterium]